MNQEEMDLLEKRRDDLLKRIKLKVEAKKKKIQSRPPIMSSIKKRLDTKLELKLIPRQRAAGMMGDDAEAN